MPRSTSRRVPADWLHYECEYQYEYLRECDELAPGVDSWTGKQCAAVQNASLTPLNTVATHGDELFVLFDYGDHHTFRVKLSYPHASTNAARELRSALTGDDQKELSSGLGPNDVFMVETTHLTQYA